MSAFTRTQKRFDAIGVCLTRAMDNVPPGKFPYLLNARSVVQGTLQARAGLIAVPTAAFGNAIHTAVRFDDATPFAAAPQLYVVGAGGNLFTGPPPNGPFPQLDTGYSGDPLSVVAATPPRSPQPWLYLADQDRMRKIDANGHCYPQGIVPPTAEPTTALQALGINVIEAFDAAIIQWGPIGTAAGVVGGVLRVNTLISEILYDQWTSNSYASIYPGTMDGINEGILVTVGTEVVAVTETTIAIAPTTIAAIQYDSGTTGLCTIQPVGSLGVGQLDTPSLADYETRYGQRYAVLKGTDIGGTGTGLPPAPTADQTPRIRQMDFPVNCLVRVGGELCRIQSVAVGKDGVQSFRCFTVDPKGAGDTLVGAPAFRCYLQGNWPGATAITDGAFTNVITPTAPDPNPDNLVPQATAGMRTLAGWAPRNLAQINGRATLAEDDVRLSIRADLCTELFTVRVYFSLEATAGSAPSDTDFTQNYYFFEWRQSDIASAIQTANPNPVDPIIQARSIAQANAITDQPYYVPTNSYGIRDFPTAIPGRSGIRFKASPNEPVVLSSGETAYRLTNPNAALTDNALSAQLALGNNQWLELKCKVGDLIHVGTDPSLTLADVTAAEIIVNVRGTDPITVAYDALWLSGGYGPDTGSVGIPYVYCHRYRSSATGGKSNPSPATRGGVIPQRQSVVVNGQQSADPQADLVDWFKIGGALTQWTYAGTTPNATPPTFTDVYEDTAIVGGDTLEFDNFPPFPTQDIPHTGTCNVAGSSLTWVSGDTFDPNWAPGSLILVNGQAYTLYSQPTSPTRLFLNENAGSGSGVPFTVVGPTILGQNFGSEWGGPILGSVFLFGCRDPLNPGQVHWSKGNDPESSSDKNTLDITAGSEPLQAGFMWDGVSFVASTENLYGLEITFGSTSDFRPVITPCGRGFWTPWAWCVAPEGVYFVAKDGIYLTTGGSAAKCITDLDLYPLFPHDGVPGQPVNGYQPVDMGATTAGPSGAFSVAFGCSAPEAFAALRLAYVDGWVIFDYMDLVGIRRTLSYRVSDASWWPDATTPGANVHAAGTGELIHECLVGGTDGQLYRQGGLTDDGTSIPCQFTLVDNQGDARRFKLYRDLFLKGQLDGARATVALSVTDQGTALPLSTLTGIIGQQDYILDTVPQLGIFGTNLTIQVNWTPASPTSPIWEAFDIAYQLAPELASSWLSGPTTHGQRGYQQVPRVLICYLSTGPVTLSLVIDDGTVYTYPLPSTFGLYAKNQIVLQSVKSKTFQWGMQGAGFLLFDADCEIWLSVWGLNGGYIITKPF